MPRIDYIPFDLRHWQGLDAAIPSDVTEIYHLAAVVGVEKYMADPLTLIDINVIASREIIRICRSRNIKLIFASTSEVYGRNPHTPWREDGDRVLGPTSVSRWSYGTSKAIVEHILFGTTQANDLEFRIVRFFNVYGPSQEPGFLVSRNLHRLLNELPALSYDNGNQTRCFTYIDDAVEGVLRLAESENARNTVVNIGSAFEHTTDEVLREIVNSLGYGEIEQRATGDLYGAEFEDILKRVPDCNLARTLLGWSASTTLTAGIAKTTEWSKQCEWWKMLPVVEPGIKSRRS